MTFIEYSLVEVLLDEAVGELVMLESLSFSVIVIMMFRE